MTLEHTDFENVPLIPEYFKGKSVFITGGSGFLGKLLIEKLLYSCSELDKIYLLMRSKKGVDSEERLTSLYSNPCYDRLRNEKPEIFKSKVRIIAGDVVEPYLGISQENREFLKNTINVIFHGAASVRFDDKLSVAVKLNLGGTKEMIRLAKEMYHLESFVHVSTAYSNIRSNCIGEVMYQPFANWQETIEVCETLDSHTLEILTQKYIEGIPNTYAFTKQLAEHLVYEEKGKLPIVIYRPAIVTQTVVEPFPGWIDNFNGPVGVNVAGGKGILRSMYGDPNSALHTIPVCAIVRAAIAAAWLRGTKTLENSDEVTIYNGCDDAYSFTHMEMLKYGRNIVINEIPFDDTLWAPSGYSYPNFTEFYIRVILFQLLPALIIDGVLLIIGKKPKLIKIQRRIYTACVAVGPYNINQWTFSNNNFKSLCSKIKEKDQKDYNFLFPIDKQQYYRDNARYLKQHLLKENFEDIPKLKAHIQRTIVLDKILKTFFYGYLFWCIYCILVTYLNI